MAQDKLQYEFKINGIKREITDITTLNQQLSKTDALVNKISGKSFDTLSPKVEGLSNSLVDLNGNILKTGEGIEDSAKKGGEAFDELSSNVDNFGKTLNIQGEKGAEFGQKLDKSAKGAEKSFIALSNTVELFGGDSQYIAKVVNALKILNEVTAAQSLIAKSAAKSDNASTTGKLQAVGELIQGQTAAKKSTEALATAEETLAGASAAAGKNTGGLANSLKLGNPYLIAAAVAVAALVVAYNYAAEKKKEQIALEEEMAKSLIATNRILQERNDIRTNFENQEIDVQIKSLTDQLAILELQNGSLEKQENIRKRILLLQNQQTIKNIDNVTNLVSTLNTELVKAEESYKQTLKTITDEQTSGISAFFKGIVNNITGSEFTPTINAEQQGKLNEKKQEELEIQKKIDKAVKDITILNQQLNQQNLDGVALLNAQNQKIREQYNLQVQQEVLALKKEQRDAQNRIDNSNSNEEIEAEKLKLKKLEDLINDFDKKIITDNGGSLTSSIQENLSNQIKLITETYDLDFRIFKTNEERKNAEAIQKNKDRITELNKELSTGKNSSGDRLNPKVLEQNKILIKKLTEENANIELNAQKDLNNKLIEQQIELKQKLINEFNLPASVVEELFAPIINGQDSANDKLIEDAKVTQDIIEKLILQSNKRIIELIKDKQQSERNAAFSLLEKYFQDEVDLSEEGRKKILDNNERYGLLNIFALIKQKQKELEILKKATEDQIAEINKIRKSQIDKNNADPTLSNNPEELAKANAKVNADADGQIKNLEDKFTAVKDFFNGTITEMLNGAAKILESFSDSIFGVADALNELANVQDQIRIDQAEKEIEDLQELQDRKEEIISQSNSNINDIENQLKTAKGSRHAYLLGLLATEQRHLQDAENEKEALVEQEKKRDAEIKQLQKDGTIRALKMEKAVTIAAGITAEARIIASLAGLGPFGLAAGITAAVALAVETGIRVATLDKQIAAAQEAAMGGELSGPSHAQEGIRGTGAFGNIEVEGGEYIVRKKVVENNRDIIQKLNSLGDTTRFALVPADQSSIKYRAAYGAQVQENFAGIQQALTENSASSLEPIVQAIRDIQISIGVDQITDQQKKVAKIEQLASTKRV